MDSPTQIAHRRLYPPLSEPNYLTLRSRRLIFNRWVQEFEGNRLRVLDVGGQYQPYRPLLKDRVERYIMIDLTKTEFVSVVGDGETLPFADESFDLAIVTQVVEFFRDPRAAVQQIHAALKPGGTLLASFSSFLPRFANGELWRFTSAGLRMILDPFAKVEIVPELYSFGGAVRTANLVLDSFMLYKPVRRLYRVTGCPLLNLGGLALESLKLTRDDRFTTNYSVRAVKAG